MTTNIYASHAANLGGAAAMLAGVSKSDSVSLPIDEVIARDQIRKVFDGQDSTIAELAASIEALGQLQEILVQPCDDGYRIIAGERRWRAMKQLGREEIRAYICDVDDATAEAMQLAENVHRLNLEQIELAGKLSKQLDELGGNLGKLAKATQKSKGWLSKVLSLADVLETKDGKATFPETARVVEEGLSADVEVLGAVKRIERENPKEAAAIVDKLKEQRGQKPAREVVKEVRKQTAAEQGKPAKQSKPKDAGKKATAPEIPRDVYGFLEYCWNVLAKTGFDGQAAVDSMGEVVASRLGRILREDFQSGSKSADPIHDMLYRMGTEMYGHDSGKRFRTAAFLAGAMLGSESAFELADVMTSARVGR